MKELIRTPQVASSYEKSRRRPDTGRGPIRAWPFCRKRSLKAVIMDNIGEAAFAALVVGGWIAILWIVLPGRRRRAVGGSRCGAPGDEARQAGN
jgi:hypothetical protein